MLFCPSSKGRPIYAQNNQTKTLCFKECFSEIKMLFYWLGMGDSSPILQRGGFFECFCYAWTIGR